jgi:hypothetical protein
MAWSEMDSWHLTLLAESTAGILSQLNDDIPPGTVGMRFSLLRLADCIEAFLGNAQTGLLADIHRMADSQGLVAEDLHAVLSGLAASVKGRAPIAQGPAGASIGGLLAQANWDAAANLFREYGSSPGPLGVAIKAAVAGAKDQAEDVAKVLNIATGEQVAIDLRAYEKEAGDKEPDVWLRAGKLLGMTTAAGAAATITADLASSKALGSGTEIGRSLAGFLGHLSGWDPIFKAAYAPFCYAYLQHPMEEWWNAKLTPYHPDLRTTLRLRAKRLLTPV